MKPAPAVSVIIIFLNAERFLREAIESVLAQTYRDWELLLVDDGSTDGSTRIALEYGPRFPGKIKCLEHENHCNRGMSASRNWGVKHSSGEYIAFLDADDVWLPSKLEEQLAILDSQPEAAMVCSSIWYWHSWTGKRKDLRRDFECPIGARVNALIQPPEIFVLSLTEKGSFPGMNDPLIRRKAFDDLGGFEDEFRGLHEDQIFFVKLTLQHPVYVTNKRWALYRQHPGSHCTVAGKSRGYRAAVRRYLQWIRLYLLSNEVTDTFVWSALRKAEKEHSFRFAYRVARQVKRLSPLAIARSVRRRLKARLLAMEGDRVRLG